MTRLILRKGILLHPFSLVHTCYSDFHSHLHREITNFMFVSAYQSLSGTSESFLSQCNRFALNSALKIMARRKEYPILSVYRQGELERQTDTEQY